MEGDPPLGLDTNAASAERKPPGPAMAAPLPDWSVTGYPQDDLDSRQGLDAGRTTQVRTQTQLVPRAQRVEQCSQRREPRLP